MSDDERLMAITIIAFNPTAGDIVSGGGGVRKVRVPKRNKGKSGGYRVLTYYMTENEPVFLLTVLNKSKQANLSERYKHDIKAAAKELRNDR